MSPIRSREKEWVGFLGLTFLAVLFGFSFSSYGQDLIEVSNLLRVDFGSEKVSLDCLTRKVSRSMEVTLTNISGKTIVSPLYAVHEETGAHRFQMEEVSESASRKDSPRKGYYDLRSHVSNGRMRPGERVVFQIKVAKAPSERDPADLSADLHELRKRLRFFAQEIR
jgi:hypothetical protein